MGETISPSRRFFQLLALLYLALLSWMLLAPAPWIVFGEGGQRLAEKASRTVADYFQHAGAFLLLTILADRALHISGTDRFVLWAGLILGYAAFTEVAQAWIPDRQFQWLDLLANLLGIGSGLVLAHLLRRSPHRPAS